MTAEQLSHNQDQLLPNQHAEAVQAADALLAGLRPPADQGDMVQTDGYRYAVTRREDGSIGREEIVVGRNKGAHGQLEASRSVTLDDSLLQPRDIETVRILADLPGVVRAQLMIIDGRVQLADFRDAQETGNTITGQITPKGLEDALFAIETTQEALARDLPGGKS